VSARARSVFVLFDLDVTLVDHDTAFRAGMAALRGASGGVGGEPEFNARWSQAQRRNFDLFLQGRLTYEEQGRARVRETIRPDLSDAAADGLFASYLTAYENAWALFPDVSACLDALAGYRLGLITNGQSAQQRLKLEKTGLTQRFAHVTVSDECGAPKPDARIFLHACRACGVSPSEAVYVGDHYEIDALGARHAGLTGVWLDRAGARSESHEGPTIGSLHELPALLETLAH
jgi:putative hydrolase of the HAD superfamily